MILENQMVNIEYFKTKVAAERAAAERAETNDPVASQRKLLREFVASYIESAVEETGAPPRELLTLRRARASQGKR
jgi:hypothetical protein